MKRLLILLLLTTAPAFADQPTSTAADRIAIQLGRLVIQVEQQQDTINSLQARIEDLMKSKTKPQENSDAEKVRSHP